MLSLFYLSLFLCPIFQHFAQESPTRAANEQAWNSFF